MRVAAVAARHRDQHVRRAVDERELRVVAVELDAARRRARRRRRAAGPDGRSRATAHWPSGLVASVANHCFLPNARMIFTRPSSFSGSALELRVARHHRALADGLAAVEDDLLDLIVGDARLPRGVGVVARLDRQALRGRAIALAVCAVTRHAQLAEQRLRTLVAGSDQRPRRVSDRIRASRRARPELGGGGSLFLPQATHKNATRATNYASRSRTTFETRVTDPGASTTARAWCR